MATWLPEAGPCGSISSDSHWLWGIIRWFHPDNKLCVSQVESTEIQSNLSRRIGGRDQEKRQRFTDHRSVSERIGSAFVAFESAGSIRDSLGDGRPSVRVTRSRSSRCVVYCQS